MALTSTLARRAYFSAGRRLAHPAWSDERNRQVFGQRFGPHGHDYVLDVFYSGQTQAQSGMIVNVDDLKPVLAAVVALLDGRWLERELEYFRARRPTAENIVDFIWLNLPAQMGAGRLSRLRLQETSRCWSEKTEAAMRVTYAFEFAAAHRLHLPHLSDEENQRLYGKCNNLYGHGHNFGLEVTLEGEPDAATGVIIAPEALDRIVQEEVYARFDHKHLNLDCPEFSQLMPTTENLARLIFEHLQARLRQTGHALAKVGLHETQKNYFEVEA